MPEQQPCSQVVDVDLWVRWREEGQPDAREQLIRNYIPLVRFVCSRLINGIPRHLTQDDLFSYGIMGLMDAIDKFDYQRGLKFETYATWRVKGAILDALRKEDWVPRSVRDSSKKLENAYAQLEQEHLRTVSAAEVSRHLNMELSEFYQVVKETAVSLQSLDEARNDDEEETRLSQLTDPFAILPSDSVDEQFLRETLAKAIDRLTPRERTVVSLFYFNELSVSEIAEVLELTPSRVSQLHSKAIVRLREALGGFRKQFF